MVYFEFTHENLNSPGLTWAESSAGNNGRDISLSHNFSKLQATWGSLTDWSMSNSSTLTFNRVTLSISPGRRNIPSVDNPFRRIISLESSI